MKLREYWPEFIKDILEFDQIAEAEQPEFDKAHKDVKEITDNFFLLTLNEYGCKRWEKILNIPAKSKELKERREEIILKYLDQIPYTYKSFIKYLEAMCGKGNFNVFLDNDNYIIYISFDISKQFKKEEYDSCIRKIIPANLCINSMLHYNSVKASVYTVCHFKAAQSITIHPYFPEPYTAKTNMSALLTYKTGMKIKIGGQK